MEQLTLDLGDRDTWCGKTSPARSLRERQAEKTSESSSKKSVKSQTKKFLFLDLTAEDGATREQSWETDFRLHGELWTLNFGEFPSVAVESHLSQILEATPHPKYYLSAKGCDGVISRADRRGKTNFPEVLREALEEQSEYLKSHPNAINEATEWYESHPNAINDKVGTLCSAIQRATGNTQDNTLCYETYRKTAHPRNDKEPQGYEKADKADTLNVFDNTETRTPMLVKEARWGGYDGYNASMTGDKASTLGVNCGMSTGRNGVVEATFTPRQGAKAYGIGYTEDKSNTLKAEQQTAVMVLNDQGGGNNECFKRQNGNSPSADKRTSPDNDRAGPTVALNILQGSANGECIENHSTQPIALDRAAYNQGKNANYDIGVDESGTAFTVVAKGPGLVKE